MRLIDADAFIEENKEIIDCEIDHPKYQDTIRELIDNAPTIKTFTLADIEEQYRKGLEKGLEERPHGKIVTGEDGNTSCSECGQTSVFGNFCYNCGADMREVKQNE